MMLSNMSYAERVLRAGFRLSTLGSIFILTIHFYREEKNTLSSLESCVFLSKMLVISLVLIKH